MFGGHRTNNNVKLICSRSDWTTLCYEQVMTQLADQIASSRPPFRSHKQAQYVTSMSVVGETQGQGGTYKGLAALFGDPKDQLALSVFSLLPWLCLHFQHTPFTPVAQACIKVRCSEPAAASHAHWCHLLKHERYANGKYAIMADQAVASQLPIFCCPEWPLTLKCSLNTCCVCRRSDWHVRN